jgi:hypothetical protein
MICEQSANALSAERALQQFVNRVQPIVNLDPAKMGLKQPNNLVVEHKGTSDAVADFRLYVARAPPLHTSGKLTRLSVNRRTITEGRQSSTEA